MSSSDGIGNLRSIEHQFDRECVSVADIRALEDIRNRYLSRKSGLLTTQLQNLRNIPSSERAAFGQTANEIKVKIESALDALQARLSGQAKNAALERERLDVTLPGNRRRIGHPHPLTTVRKEIEDIFVAMGYTVEDGPEVERPTTPLKR
jgi:phenylalanyl-tRNA synthetase alpha chain